MKRWQKIISIILAVFIILPFLLSLGIKKGWTNAPTVVDKIPQVSNNYIPSAERQINKYISEHPEDTVAVVNAWTYMRSRDGAVGTGRFPNSFKNDRGFMFILNGIKKRKDIYNTIITTSNELKIEPEMVLSAIMPEQIRIATSGKRGEVKSAVMNYTPTWFVSYDVSLGIGGVKVTTARDIAEDAKVYGYGIFGSYTDEQLYTMLTESDYRQAIYPTYLVKNIITRWDLEGYDISRRPGIVGTLYNMGNAENKKPNANPAIGGTIITVGGNEYSFGALSEMIYRYLKIYS